MKAIILAAGLGTRLRPITEKIPKALIEVNGTPMIERVLLKLKSHGVADVIINLHHYPEMIKIFLESKNNFGLNISYSDETDQVLETGGGLLRASWFFNDGEPFFVHNVDVISNVDLTEMWEFHKKHNSLATLFVQNRNSSRYLLFNEDHLLKGWANIKTGETIKVDGSGQGLTKLAFNGIHIIDPKIFTLIKKTGVFSIIGPYLELAGKYPIRGFSSVSAKYIDIGKPESLLDAEELVRQMGT